MASEKAPLVSICLPVYNGARTLTSALDSLVSQSWRNIEIIICDDGSRDETPQICAKYARKYSNIIFEINEKNLGAGGKNFRKTLSKANGKYAVWASQDDMWHPDFVKCLTEKLEDNPGALAAMGAVKHFVVNHGQEWSLQSRLQAQNWPQNNSKFSTYFYFFSQPGHSEQLRQSINPELALTLFIHGVVRTDIFRQTMASLPPNISTIRPVISQWPLIGELIYVDEVLFYKEELSSFLSPKHDLSEAGSYLDDGLFKEFEKRRSRKNGHSGQASSKFEYALTILKSHLSEARIPLFYKWAPILLFLSYLTRHVFKPVKRLLRRKRLNNKYNLLKTPPEKFKNLTPKSPLP